MREWEWEGMGINILLRDEMDIFLYTTIWEWEYGHRKGREWNRKSHFHTSLLPVYKLQNSIGLCIITFEEKLLNSPSIANARIKMI